MIVRNASKIALLTSENAAGQRRAIAHDRPDPTVRSGPALLRASGVQEVPSVRNYVPPKDDGLEPTDFDEYHDIPAQTAKDLAARVYVKIERDPGRAARLDKRQNEAIMEALKWGYANRAQLRAQGHTLPESWPE